MTLTDYASRSKGPPEWIEEDQIVSVQGLVGNDIIVELKLTPSDHYDDLRFELIRDGLPISSDRYRLSMRGNVVQLALKQSRKNDAGYYSLVATRLGQDKGASKKIHMSVDETSYEEGEPPIFLRRLSDLAVKVGTRTRFLVEVRSATTPKITWYKNDAAIYEVPRFSLVHEGNFYCVDVVPVTVEDQGHWTCMAENRSGRSSCMCTLTVVVPKAYKKPEFIEELRALLTEAGTVSLECKVVGVPTPVLRWFKDNEEIKAGDVFALTANPDDPTSLGVYTCEAVNCMGTSYSSSKVHVVGRGSREGSLKPADALAPSGPLPIFKQTLQDECCRIGDTLVLSCRVQVPPWPRAISWYNKAGRVEPSEKYHVMEDGIGGYSVEVKQVEAMDEGEWKCVATSEENMKQFTSCYVAMSIPRNYRKPRFMENLKAVLTEEGLVSFECKVVGFPTPLLRWFKDGEELKPGDVYQLTGTNSLGSYCCIARNCMGEAKSTAELTIEDIQNQLNEEERFQLLSSNQPPKFIKGLRSCEAKINEDFQFTVQVSVAPEPSLSWYRDDAVVDENDKYRLAKENLGTCHLEVRRLEFVDQAEWKCVAANDFGHSVTSCFLKLIIPKHYKKPKFLESLRAILSEEGAVNLECKVIGVPQPVLKWYKDNVELKPGDIHRIISGQDGTCCLGTYTCEATNCMGTVSSSASLLGFEDKKPAKEIQPQNGHELARNLSLSTIHEERTSQLYDTPQTDHSVTLDERGEVSFSFDGKEVSVSLYETPDLTEEEALQIVEMYADQLSEHVTEHNVIELPPMRFVKETSTSGNLLMEAVVIDVSPDYFVSAEDGDDLRTEADFEDVSIMDDLTHVLSSPERDSRGSLKRAARHNGEEDEKAPSRPPRKKSMSVSSSKSERSQRFESESFHSAQKDEPPLSPLSSMKQDDSDTFADALSSAHLSITESLVQRQTENSAADNRKRSLSAERTAGSSLDDGIGGDSSFDSVTGALKKQRKKKQRYDKSNSEEYSGPSDYEEERESELKGGVDTKTRQRPAIESLDKIETDIGSSVEQKTAKKSSINEEKLLDNSKSARKATPAFPDHSVSVKEQTLETTEDILLEPKMTLHEALQTYEKISESSSPRLSNIRQQVDDIYRKLEILRGKSEDIELLINLEPPLRALLKTIGEIKLVEDVEIVRNILEPSIFQLSQVVADLQLSSLQPTLAVLRKINESIRSISNGTERSSSAKSISDESRNISREIVDPLINVQATFSTILDCMEQSRHIANGSASPQQALSTSGFAACLIELRECVSHAAHTAMTLKENETFNSLMEFAEPLLDLQLILKSEEYTPRDLPMIKETIVAIESLKSVITTVAKSSEHSEAISRVGAILKTVEDTGRQMSKLAERLSEAKDARKHMLKNLNVDQSLSGVHFALSSVLEKQDKYAASSHLINCIEVLRQTVGSSALAIANLKDPMDNEITREISRLNESLLDLQRNLLTEKHEPGEEAVLCNLMTPVNTLKEILHDVIENGSAIESIVPMLQLLEEIEKDAPLVAKEISKRKKGQDAVKFDKDSKPALAGQISRSLDPIKHWLSTTSEGGTRDEIESALSSTIEELKRDVTKIAIQTSYSEPPSDKSLIEALIDLREPLTRLQNAVAIYHEPEDLSTLEGLGRPMKHLLQIIMDVLREHQEEESLRPIVSIVEQIENQISLSIREALYQQELKQSDRTFAVETEEEVVTASRETVPGTLTEIASIPLEASSTTLPTEQTTTEDGSKKVVDDVALQIVKDKKHEREENASKLIMILSETLEKLQLEMTGILEDFEESTTRTSTIPQSKLANSLEELRRTISTIRVMTIVYSEDIGSFEEKVNQATLVLTNLLQPLTNIREVLLRTHDHDVLELMILNRLTPLLNTIENDVIKQTTDFVGKGEETEREFESLLCVLGEIKEKVPVVVQEISSRRKILECLRDISKPLDSILERMSDLEKAAEETLETDVAKILGKPTTLFLKDIKVAAQELDVLGQRGPVILELYNLLEPLLEFHSCLSMVQSSRRSLITEASLLDERRSVILRAIEGLQKQVCHTVEAIANMTEASLFNESLTQLNFAILQLQKQIGKTDYSRRSSSIKIPLQHRLTGTLNRLSSTITALKEHPDQDTHEIVFKCLEALQKQISLAQTQLIQTDGQLIDEEAIVEGFLYPTNQLLSALNIIKENAQQGVASAISPNLTDQLRQLADSISEMSSSLSAHKTELVQEGALKGAPIVETFSAVVDVLDHVKDTIMTIEEIAESERKASMVVTKVESVTDEIIEISQEEIESVMTVTEIPPVKAVAEENAQLKIEDTPIAALTTDSENRDTTTRIEQTEDMKKRKSEEEKEEKEKQKRLYRTQLSKFNSSIANLEQPLRELVGFVKSAMLRSTASKSEEDKQKIRELTVLIQNLYDLQATSASIKAALPSSLITSLDSQFHHIEDIFVDFARTIDTVISLTHGEVRPELKENIIVSLQSFTKPLTALENALVSVCETIDEDKCAGKDEEPLSTTLRTLIPCINDTLKSLNEIEILKCVKIINEKEGEMSTKMKEETKDIEKTTARPLEELIEAIMDSQEEVKGDKTSPFESTSPSTDPIESKDIDDFDSMEVKTKLSKVAVGKVDSSVQQIVTSVMDTAETLQALVSSPDQIEELLVEEKVLTPKSLTESLEEVEELKLTMIAQQKAELSQSESVMMQEGQVKVETIRAIICPLQEVCKTIDEEMRVPELFDKKAVALTALIEPLLKLEITLNREIQQTASIPCEGIEEIKQDTMTLQKLSVTAVLEELQKSIATVQEQVQLNTVTEGSSSETSKARLMQAVEHPLEDLKISIACIQHDTMTCQQETELSSTEHITVLQAVAKTVEEFGDKCMSIIGQLKIESEPAPPSQVVKQEDQKLDPEVLHKIVDPIHVLHETLSQIEEGLQDRKVELSEMPEQKREAVQLSAIMQPLEKLEQSLTAGMQQITVMQEHVPEELGENRISLESANLRPVLEELRNSIIVVQQQAAVSEDVLIVKTINEALEGLKMPLATVEEIVDHLNEATETETVSTLLTFAKSVEETANQLLTATSQQMVQQETQESPLLRMITIPIEGLQSAILRLEDRMCQTLETEKPTKAVALECMLQPLQQLQQTFLTAPHEETALSLQRLPIKPTLDDLSKFVAVIQDQVTTVQDKLLIESNIDDLATLKDFARSLGDLRTSTVVLQQLNAIENAGRQIIEIENASALQAFAKSIEEFRRCCCVVVERPKIVEAFATSVESEQSTKMNTHLLENIIAPLRILQEQILIIEETKMHQSEILDVTEERKPATVLSSLVGPLQQLEKSFVATVQKEHVIEAHNEAHRLTPELSSMNLEKLALQPILEEVQKSIATVQEHVILEAGSHVASETDAVALLKSIAQPLVDLRASVASIQQVTAVAPDSLNELGQQQNVSTLETFAETLHNLAERIAMCNHQQIVMEPTADTISEDASSLNTWADVIEEPVSRITRPMVINQGTVESPASIAGSISEDEVSVLKTLAKPLTELRECLALIVEERKVIAPSENASPLTENESISLLKTMVQPLLELKDAAAIAIQEQTAIERASEHSFAIEGKSEFVLRPLVEPLEELRHSIAVIQDQMLIETSTDRPKEDFMLNALAEPLFDLQRAISVLEARVVSPDIESMPDDTSNWITECLATPLHEIERSIADIRQCTVMEPPTTVVEAQRRTPDWSIIEKLVKPMVEIGVVISHMESDSPKTEAIKAMMKPLASVQENLTLLKNKSNSGTFEDESNTDAIVESLSNLEKCISFVERKIIDKPLFEQSRTMEADNTISSVLSSPLNELKRSIVTVEESPSEYLKNLEKPLELVQNALETIVSVQRREKLSNLSTKLQKSISDINDSIETIGRRLEEQQMPIVIEVHIEYEALGMLTKPLRNVKQCIAQLPEEPNIANSMINALQNLKKSVSVIREQSADKPLAESQDTHLSTTIGFSKNLVPCLHEIQESIETTKTLWQKETVLEGLTILEEPICKLQTLINIMRDQFLEGETIWITDKEQKESKKKLAKEEPDKEYQEKLEKKKEKQKKEDKKLKVKEEPEQQKTDKDKRSKEEEKEQRKEETVKKVDQTKKEVKKEEDEQKEKKETAKSEKREKIEEGIKMEEREQKKEEIIEKPKEDKDDKGESVKDKKKEEVKELKKKEESSKKDETALTKTEVERPKIEDEVEKTKKDETEKRNKEESEKPRDKKVTETKTDESIKKKEAVQIKEEEQTEKSKEEEEIGKLKKEKIEKVEEFEKEKEESSKKEATQLKMKEEEQKKKDETEKSKKEEITEKPKEKKVEKTKSEKTEDLEKKIEESSKKDETAQIKTKEEEQKKKDGADKSEKEEIVEKSKNEKVEKLEEKIEELSKKGEAAHMKIEKEEQKEKDKTEKSKKEETIEKLEEENIEKLKSKKTEESEKKTEESSKKEEIVQVKMKEEQAKKDEDEKSKKEDIIEKSKEEKDEKPKSKKVEESKKKKEESSKKEEAAQVKMKEEEQKKKNGDKKPKKKETVEKSKEEKGAKPKSEKVEKSEKKKEESSKKEEAAQVKMKEEEQKKKDEADKSKKEEIVEKSKSEKAKKLEEKIEEPSKKEEAAHVKMEEEQKEKDKTEKSKEEVVQKPKEEKVEKPKSEKIEEPEKKIEKFNKQEEVAQVKMKEEKQKQKDEAEKSKKDEKQKQSIAAEKAKVTSSEQTEMIDIQEKKKTAIQSRSKRESKQVEKIDEKQIEKKKEEIPRMDEKISQTQSVYVNDVTKKNDVSENERQYKKSNEAWEREEKSHIKQKEKKFSEKISESQVGKDKDLRSKITEDKEIKVMKRAEERLQRWPQDIESDESRIWKERYDGSKRDYDDKPHQIEIEHLTRKKGVSRFKRDETDYASGANEEKAQRWSDEKWLRKEENARLLREEEQRLRKRRDEEISRSKQRREELIREMEWSRKRQSESDRFLRDMLETKYKPEKSTSMFFDTDYSRDKWEHISRFDSGISTMFSSTSRSYSWRDSLTSLNRRRIDDYWNYKLRNFSTSKYYMDTGSPYRRRRRRENRMIRARSTGLLKYEDYSTGDSDATLVPSTRIRLTRRAKTETVPRISLDSYDSSSSSYVGLSQSSESLSTWDKPKKPSFCTRLTNRVVGIGMRTRLTCTVLGNPEPRVHWTKDGEKLDASSNRYKTRCENGMAYLELHDALPEDAGVYMCVAENTHGTSTSESFLKVYSDYKPTYSPPSFVKSIKDIYRYSDHKLVLECRVRAYPAPTVSWWKDGQILQGQRYRQTYLDDDVYRLEIVDPDASDNGQYTCRAANELRTEEVSHMIRLEDRERRLVSRSDQSLSNETGLEVPRRPRFSSLLKDYSVPAGGTIALQVEVKGEPAPEVRWFRGDRKEPIAIPKARTIVERGLHTLIVPEATESEKGTYFCRAINAYGQVDTSATVDVISPSAIDGGKPAMFVSRLMRKSIDAIVGEDVSVSFRVSGVPKPRVTWLKGLTDITGGPRSYKESIDDYVRLTLKRAVPSDEGTYCILVKNRYGCDRCFFSIKVKQRARSLTPSPDWSSITERDAEELDDDMSYVRNVPGPISSEPVVVDGGKNWLSLTWGKAERRGPAPVIAYKVEAWLLGGEGGARWVELGITPINTFDAFNLRPGGEYKFRVTPRNRYGWGEPVTMTNSAYVSESTDLPEFTKILPGQLKALEGTLVKLECEIRGDPKMEVRWYREMTELDPRSDSRFAIYYDASKYSLTIANVNEDDSGRYVCEASNRIGKVSSFARVLVVNDLKIIEADAKLRTSLSIEPEDKPPQFTMRIRDRRVQTTYPVRLTCQVIGHPAPEITWYKNEEEIFQDDRHIFWDDDSNFHTLEIIHSNLEDSGCYMATARNINGSVSCRCTLVVDKGIRAYIAPEFLRDLDAAYTIQLGGELRMSAQLEAYPSVGVVWHRDGIRLRPSRRAVMTLSHDGAVQFSLANITDRDAGVYTCTATNAVGHTETNTRVAVVTSTSQDHSFIDRSYNITSATPDIPYSKEPLFVTKPLSTEAVEGDTVIILCEVVGDPKPEVIWLRDFLKPEYYRDAPHFRLVGAGPQYRLEIPYAKLDFTGTYSVIARNCHGEAKAIISLQIYAKGQGKEDQTQKSSHGKVLTLPIIKRELRDLRCCDGDAVSLECKVYATPEPPLVRWERGGKIITMVGDFAAEFDGETARLSIQHVYPEDEGEYTCVAYNDLGKAYTSACLVVDVPEGKENILSQRLTRPIGLLSAGSTPRSTPRSTPIRSLSPAVSHGREFRSPQVLSRRGTSKRTKVCPPKFYAVPHNRLVQEGETVRFQCAVVGHPAPWIRWDKNGIIVTPSARISIKERDDVKILEIVDVMREDAALYRVTAENDFGRIEASARLEVISRYESTSRTIRTRSASPRTYPTFDRSLLPTTSRINGRLQLECRVRGTPSVTPTWYRNGRPLERSARIKRYFDGATAKIEISKVKASDAGEYTCVATNVLGSTRNSCQVNVLHSHDSSTADKDAPQFLQPLPEESIVMENHPHEFQTGITGTPPFTVTWSRDGRELPDNDYYKYVLYGDGGVALRLPEVRPQDAGEYTCVVRNNFGVASCSNLFAVQGYKDVAKLSPQFTKTPLSAIVAKGSAACFIARVQCGKATDIVWTINGRDARENAKCKIERNGGVSILRIRDVTSRETGEIRCTATVSGKGLSIGCVARLRLRHSNDLGNPAMGSESGQSYSKLLTPDNGDFTSTPGRVAPMLKRRQPCEESPTRIRSSSFPRRSAPSCTKHASPLATRRCAVNNIPMNARKSRFDSDLSIAKHDFDSKTAVTKLSSDRGSSFSSNDEEDATDNPKALPRKASTESHGKESDDIGSCMKNRVAGPQTEPKSDESNDREEIICWQEDQSEKNAETRTKKPIRASIIKEPSDVIVFKGNRAVLQVTYQGRPEPAVKWLRVNRQLLPGEKIDIDTGDGVSRLTLDDVTYDHAGKYEVSVENSAGKERRFFSLAVEGPPEPPADKPSINLSVGQATIVWRSPAYDGGRTVIGYTVEAKRAGESTWMVIAESCHSLSQTLPTTQSDFVVPGESYCFRVRAENIHGLSDPSIESDPVRIPRRGETMLQEEEEENFEPSFEARIVEPEESRLFDERYDVHEELGKGRYGIVKKVIERTTDMCFAAKFVRTIKAKDREQVREEIRIMNVLRHPKLLLLAAAYESPRETVMVMEYISGGELFERVVADDFTLTERDSILFMRQICEGVEYMHQNKIVHLDLKPENVMCRTRTSHQIKLIDFGLAQTLKPDTPVRVLFGTPEFIPPEIIGYEPIGTESDMWSVGVICYVLLRMSATQCLQHPWMAQRKAAMSRVVLPTDKLKKFIVRRKWQKTGNAIRALGRMAMLSAYSRRSPTTTAESSPTLEKQFDSLEMQCPDDAIKSSHAKVNENTEHVEVQEVMHSSFLSCVMGRNMNTQEMSIDNTERKLVPEAREEETAHTDDSTQAVDHEKNFQNVSSVMNEESLMKKRNSSSNSLERINIEEKTFELTPKQSILEDIPAHPQVIESEESEERGKEKSSEVEHIVSRSQAFYRVLRQNSRDSGIGDCQMTSPLQVDELGIVSTIKEEADESEGKRIPRREEAMKNRRSSTSGILTTLARGKESSFYDTESIWSDDKVATNSGVTKASCEINLDRKVADENTDARILIGRTRDKFVPTGNVSRTARIFERDNAASKSDESQVSAAQRAYPAAIVAGKPYNERIQKAFAFWNK
ncbi:uncharacterized protein LOC116846386 isoform X2 [Odontomachus brunneus]|uniref:uncharacterized protein LOC116846386 isoform X2 n=1 Tax=Odontomachus brunneus TaxID=486640 RepID=UPI0013F1D6F6|nr:uncharacterized protein LOC116846386 isoform X2 [Odontomachus brunneus]